MSNYDHGAVHAKIRGEVVAEVIRIILQKEIHDMDLRKRFTQLARVLEREPGSTSAAAIAAFVLNKK